MNDGEPYCGEELESFALAVNWKSYVRRALHPYISGDVLEIGAGLGETTRALHPGAGARSWICVEPDPGMCETLRARMADGDFGAGVEVRQGTLSTLADPDLVDVVIYVDVLEHIEEDRKEIALAAARLRPGGRIVVLSPAYPFLYSPFDASVGHYRRYTATMLRDLIPDRTRELACRYLDCVGLLASSANRLLLKQSLPTVSQVKIWDRLMVPLSRICDPIVRNTFGRSVVMVWEKV